MADPVNANRPVRQDFAVLPSERDRGLVPSRARIAPSRRALARRRWTVRLAKVGLPLLAAGLFSLILFWPDIDGRDARLSFRRATGPEPEALQMLAPRYQGVDEASRPYTVSARGGRVARGEDGRPEGQEILVLDQPKADILLTDGGWVYLESRDGRYDRAGSLLDLEGEVTVFHDNGMMFRTQRAAVRVTEGAASGQSPTQAQGPFGTIHSEGFEMTDRGAVVIFTGRAHAVLEARE
ncbi:MAG TPA: LPS export ABC transporter periplasmic protein LptC [Roseococcus sp.]|jgi:lipopolysaccharide export system protein LptC|nr:LPS export ABC transporter periplasmic protein LptC [Roseococcus sp.]